MIEITFQGYHGIYKEKIWDPCQIDIDDFISKGFITFDIETTSIKDTERPYGFMYIWQMCGNGIVTMGRTWEEWIDFIGRIKTKTVAFVHALFFEWQFFRNFVEVSSAFFTKEREPLKIVCGKLEFRCSYRLTNMSLEKATEHYGAHYRKLSGADFDYHIKRYPWTDLTDQELGYCFCDVRGLEEVIDKIMESEGDDLKTMPLTSTGYVRRDARKAMKANKKNIREMRRCALSPHTYQLCKAASRGGNSHANPYHSGRLLQNIISFDMSSAYPAVMIQKQFPQTKFLKTSYKDLDELVEKGKAFLAVVMFENVMLKTWKTIPYIPKCKCIGLEKHKADNGRILEAERLAICICDIDYKILRETYDFQYDVIECYTARYGYLCDEYRNFIFEMYKQKCDLKGKDEFFYNKFKNRINATFGMMLTDICHENIEYDPASDKVYVKTRENQREALEKYYKHYNSFLSYQHGIYVTAHCRARLQRAINMLGEDMVYCDTDSVKFMHQEDHKDLDQILNNEIKEDIKKCGIDTHYVRSDGKAFDLGLWEKDAHYNQFITQGSKKYAYTENGKLNITVAGLSKRKGAAYLKKHGGIKSFVNGFRFPDTDSGRTAAWYDDRKEPFYLHIEGRDIYTGSSICVADVDYTLGITDDYDEIRTYIQKPYF